MKKIILTQNKYVLVDNEDFDFLNQWRWYFSHGYAVRNVNGKNMYMHRVINKTPNGLITDHINRSKLDNRRSNLRTVAKGGNQKNHKIFRTNTSGYNGISWSKSMKKWESYIWNNNKKIILGYFKNIKLAFSARLKGEMLYWKL